MHKRVYYRVTISCTRKPILTDTPIMIGVDHLIMQRELLWVVTKGREVGKHFVYYTKLRGNCHSIVFIYTLQHKVKSIALYDSYLGM